MRIRVLPVLIVLGLIVLCIPCSFVVILSVLGSLREVGIRAPDAPDMRLVAVELERLGYHLQHSNGKTPLKENSKTFSGTPIVTDDRDGFSSLTWKLDENSGMIAFSGMRQGPWSEAQVDEFYLEWKAGANELDYRIAGDVAAAFLDAWQILGRRRGTLVRTEPLNSGSKVIEDTKTPTGYRVCIQKDASSCLVEVQITELDDPKSSVAEVRLRMQESQ